MKKPPLLTFNYGRDTFSRTGVSDSDHYEEKGVLERLMDRLRRIAPGVQG